MTTPETTATVEEQYDNMVDLLLAVKAEFGRDAAKEIINTIGLAERMAEIKPEHYSDVLVACNLKLKCGEEGEDHPLDAVGAEAPQKSFEMQRLPPEALAEALAAIDAIPEAERTIEAVLGALWATWVE